MATPPDSSEKQTANRGKKRSKNLTLILLRFVKIWLAAKAWKRIDEYKELKVFIAAFSSSIRFPVSAVNKILLSQKRYSNLLKQTVYAIYSNKLLSTQTNCKSTKQIE